MLSSLANALAIVELSVELVEPLDDDELSSALVNSERLSEPSPLVSRELTSWLAASANGDDEAEVELSLPLVVDEEAVLESLSWAFSSEASVSLVNWALLGAPVGGGPGGGPLGPAPWAPSAELG